MLLFKSVFTLFMFHFYFFVGKRFEMFSFFFFKKLYLVFWYLWGALELMPPQQILRVDHTMYWLRFGLWCQKNVSSYLTLLLSIYESESVSLSVMSDSL